MGKSGREGTKESWSGMKQRCLNPRTAAYRLYGGRGITICQRWMDFAAFYEDMGDRPEGMSIDRIDVNGNYEPGNCRWADRALQRRNQRNCTHLERDGRRMTVEEWSRELGVDGETLRRRIRAGLTGDDVFTGRGIATMSSLLDGSARCNRTSKSGFRGVMSKNGRWVAQTRINGVNLYLGIFDTPEEAHQRYVDAQTDLRAEENSNA